MVSKKKRIHYLCEDEICNDDHRLASPGLPCDAKRWSSGRILTLIIDS